MAVRALRQWSSICVQEDSALVEGSVGTRRKGRGSVILEEENTESPFEEEEERKLLHIIGNDGSDDAPPHLSTRTQRPRIQLLLPCFS